jgi:hypothetical protein
LGNKRAELIVQQTTQDSPQEILNAVTMRAATAKQEMEQAECFTREAVKPEEEEETIEEKDTGEPEILRLMGVEAEEFMREMRHDP